MIRQDYLVNDAAATPPPNLNFQVSDKPFYFFLGGAVTDTFTLQIRSDDLTGTAVYSDVYVDSVRVQLTPLNNEVLVKLPGQYRWVRNTNNDSVKLTRIFSTSNNENVSPLQYQEYEHRVESDTVQDLIVTGSISGAGFVNSTTALFTSLLPTSFSSPPPIGNVTPNTGAFTVADINGNLTVNGITSLSDTNIDGEFNVTDNANIVGDLSVTGNAIFNEDAFFTQSINVEAGLALTTYVPSGVLNANTTEVGNVGGGVATLMSYTLPANALSANGKGVRVTMAGRCANNANVKEIYATFGLTGDLGNIVPLPTGGASALWRIEATVIRAASGEHIVHAIVYTNLGDGTSQSTRVFTGLYTEVDTDPIVIKAAAIGVANNDVVQTLLLVEFFN